METPKKKRGRPRKVIEPPQEDCAAISQQSLYWAKLKIAGKEYHAEAETLEDVVLNLKPLVKKGVGILTVRHGEKEIQKILSGPMTFKLFNIVSRLTREIALKNLKTLFTL